MWWKQTHCGMGCVLCVCLCMCLCCAWARERKRERVHMHAMLLKRQPHLQRRVMALLPRPCMWNHCRRSVTGWPSLRAGV